MQGSKNPFQTSETIVVSYLDFLRGSNKSYSVLNTHKSMLLQTLPFFGNTWCQNTFLISKFLKGIFNLNPPLPRYQYTWDVSTVLNFLATLFPLETLSLKLLTLKTVALVALATAARAQTLVSMDIDYMKCCADKLVFYFPNLLKTSKKGKAFVLTLEHYTDEKLCVFHTVLFYIKSLRKLRKTTKLFISYVTHDHVTTSTIARWLKTVLEMSGIDISVFKAHSYRAASVSAASSRGCSLASILKTADWKSDKNFHKFYYRDSVQDQDLSFMAAVFAK